MTRWVTAMTVLLAAAGAATAAVTTKEVEYEFGGTKLKGFLASPDGAEKRPGVLVVHEWWGLNEYAKERCKKLADLGYVAFACDMYGEGRVTKHPDEAKEFAGAVRKDVKLWRGRAEAGLKVLTSQPNVDTDKLAAIGYCFGGSTCLELAYAGAPLKAVATFHAGLPTPTPEEAKAVKAKLVVANGADDTFIPPASIKAFRGQLDTAGVKYQFDNYPGAVHSFTVADADKVGNPGMKYNKDADEKSWQQMRELFKETLGK